MTGKTTKFQFVLTHSGKVIAGPFATIDQVPKGINWNKYNLKVTAWTDAKYGKFV